MHFQRTYGGNVYIYISPGASPDVFPLPMIPQHISLHIPQTNTLSPMSTNAFPTNIWLAVGTFTDAFPRAVERYLLAPCLVEASVTENLASILTTAEIRGRYLRPRPTRTFENPIVQGLINDRWVPTLNHSWFNTIPRLTPNLR